MSSTMAEETQTGPEKNISPAAAAGGAVGVLPEPYSTNPPAAGCWCTCFRPNCQRTEEELDCMCSFMLPAGTKTPEREEFN